MCTLFFPNKDERRRVEKNRFQMIDFCSFLFGCFFFKLILWRNNIHLLIHRIEPCNEFTCNLSWDLAIVSQESSNGWIGAAHWQALVAVCVQWFGLHRDLLFQNQAIVVQLVEEFLGLRVLLHQRVHRLRNFQHLTNKPVIEAQI